MNYELEQALMLRAQLRAGGRRLVLGNGHFDLLHSGHLDYLERARRLGDALIVGVNGDASSARLKGPGRPLVPAQERARLLAALKPVTAVVIFEEDVADGLIRALRPEIYAKGADYAHKPLPERAVAEACGAQVVLIPLRPQRSSSGLIERIRALPAADASPAGSG
ncbi:MAG: adenylyltransferase/cytidyltransferase family protein [Anaerolineae bacterium]|nr:adenylyltransferase/cytidyltransferase family protein [Anaerolineae bacterium]